MASEETGSTSQTAEKFVVRLPKGMRRRIADAARAYRRSMNSEIVARLEHSLESGGSAFPEPVEAEHDPTPGPTVQTEVGPSTAEEQQLLATYRNLPPERRRALLALLG